MVDAETNVLGISHADAGLYAGMEWKFPVLLVNVIGRHHWPLDKIIPRLKTRQGRLAQRVIRIADAASYAMGYGMLRSDGTPLKSNPNSSTRPASPRKISTSGRRRSATISPLPLRRWAASEIYSLPP